MVTPVARVPPFIDTYWRCYYPEFNIILHALLITHELLRGPLLFIDPMCTMYLSYPRGRITSSGDTKVFSVKFTFRYSCKLILIVISCILGGETSGTYCEMVLFCLFRSLIS